LIFKKDLDQFVAEFSCFTKVKGEGLLLGLETTLELPKVLARALDNGLVILRAGSNVIRFLPPLTITIDEWREGIQIFKEVIQKEVQNG
jgi:acetylornithine/N-succinyldiaminopimelate aminotransferase